MVRVPDRALSHRQWTCTFPLWYISDPTDGTATSTQYFNQAWAAAAQATNYLGITSTITQSASTNTVLSFLGRTAQYACDQLRSVGAGIHDANDSATTTMSELGNVGLNQTLYGVSMCPTYPSCPVSTTSTIPVGSGRVCKFGCCLCFRNKLGCESRCAFHNPDPQINFNGNIFAWYDILGHIDSVDDSNFRCLYRPEHIRSCAGARPQAGREYPILRGMVFGFYPRVFPSGERNVFCRDMITRSRAYLKNRLRMSFLRTIFEIDFWWDGGHPTLFSETSAMKKHFSIIAVLLAVAGAGLAGVAPALHCTRRRVWYHAAVCDRTISSTQNSHYEQVITLVRSDPTEDLQAKVTINVPGANDWISIDRGTQFIFQPAPSRSR